MRAVLQRVARAAVRVDDGGGPVVVGEIPRPGLLALVGATHDDGPEQVATIARKIACSTVRVRTAAHRVMR